MNGENDDSRFLRYFYLALIFVSLGAVIILGYQCDICHHEVVHDRAYIDSLRVEILLLQDSISSLLFDPDIIITGAHLVLSNGDTVFSGYIPYPDSIIIIKNP